MQTFNDPVVLIRRLSKLDDPVVLMRRRYKAGKSLGTCALATLPVIAAAVRADASWGARTVISLLVFLTACLLSSRLGTIAFGMTGDAAMLSGPGDRLNPLHAQSSNKVILVGALGGGIALSVGTLLGLWALSRFGS